MEHKYFWRMWTPETVRSDQTNSNLTVHMSGGESCSIHFRFDFFTQIVFWEWNLELLSFEFHWFGILSQGRWRVDDSLMFGCSQWAWLLSVFVASCVSRFDLAVFSCHHLRISFMSSDLCSHHHFGFVRNWEYFGMLWCQFKLDSCVEHKGRQRCHRGNMFVVSVCA